MPPTLVVTTHNPHAIASIKVTGVLSTLVVFRKMSDALNAAGPPKTVEWSNPKNQTGGSFLVVAETTRKGLPCRRIKFATYAPGYPNPPKAWTTWTVCKVDDRWKVADTK